MLADEHRRLRIVDGAWPQMPIGFPRRWPQRFAPRDQPSGRRRTLVNRCARSGIAIETRGAVSDSSTRSRSHRDAEEVVGRMAFDGTSHIA